MAVVESWSDLQNHSPLCQFHSLCTQYHDSPILIEMSANMQARPAAQEESPRTNNLQGLIDGGRKYVKPEISACMC